MNAYLIIYCAWYLQSFLVVVLKESLFSLLQISKYRPHNGTKFTKILGEQTGKHFQKVCKLKFIQVLILRISIIGYDKEVPK